MAVFRNTIGEQSSKRRRGAWLAVSYFSFITYPMDMGTLSVYIYYVWYVCIYDMRVYMIY